MDASGLINANPIVYEVNKEKVSIDSSFDYHDELERDELTPEEVFGECDTVLSYHYNFENTQRSYQKFK